MSELVIFDTSVLVDDLRSGRHKKRVETVAGFLRNSAVVLAELWRGVSKAADREFVRALSRAHPVLTPTEDNWLESEQLLAKMRAEHGYERDKLRDLHFDVLIALTARTHDARLITCNGSDFLAIQSHCEFRLEVW